MDVKLISATYLRLVSRPRWNGCLQILSMIKVLKCLYLFIIKCARSTKTCLVGLLLATGDEYNITKWFKYSTHQWNMASYLKKRRQNWLTKIKARKPSSACGCIYSLDWTTGLTYFWFYTCCGWLNWFLLAESHLNDKHEQQNHKCQLKILLLAIQHLYTPFTFHVVGNIATDTYLVKWLVCYNTKLIHLLGKKYM